MVSFLSFYYFLIALILLSMMFAVHHWSRGVPRNQSYYLLALGIALPCLGMTITAITFSLNVHAIPTNIEFYKMFEASPDPFYKVLLLIGFFISGTGLLFQPLYFKSLHGTISKKVWIIVACAIIFYFFIVITLSITLKESRYPLQSVSVLLYMIGILAWMVIQVRKYNVVSLSPLMQFLRILCIGVLFFCLVWVGVLLITIFNGHFLVFTGPDIFSYDIPFRFLRVAFLLFIQLIIILHWAENFSSTALKIKLNDEKINNLLEEKDRLIETLSNTNTLNETGALSAGLSHELNQYLARIQVNGDQALALLKDPNLKPGEIKYSLQSMIQANQLAAGVVLNLKKLFFKNEGSPVPSDLDLLVQDVTELYRDRLRKSHIQIVLDLKVEGLWIVWDSLFRQVVLNLISNAIDALDSISHPNKLIRIESFVNDVGWYSLSVSDNGPGLNPQQANNIFSIFSSTKDKGTGIGLWLSSQIIGQHHGKLEYKNLEDGGVTFIVTIPPHSTSQDNQNLTHTYN